MSTTNNPVDNKEALNNITANLPKLLDTPKVLAQETYEGKTYTQLLFPTTTYQYDNLKCDLLVPFRLIGLVLGVAVDIFQAILILPPVINNYFSDRDIKNLTGERKKSPTMEEYNAALEKTEAAESRLNEACARNPRTRREEQMGFDADGSTMINLSQDYEAKKSISDSLFSQIDQAAERYDTQINAYLNKHLNTEGVTDLDKAIDILNEAMRRAVNYNYAKMSPEQRKELAADLLQAGYVKLVEVFINDIKSKASEKRAAVSDEYIAGQASKLASFYGGDAAIITMQMRSALGTSLVELLTEDFNEADEETLQALTQERRAKNEKIVSEFEANIETSREVLASSNGEFIAILEKLNEAKVAAKSAKAMLDKAYQLEQKARTPRAKEELLGFDEEGNVINLSQNYAAKKQAFEDLQSQCDRLEEATNALSNAVYQSEDDYNEAKAEIEKDMESGIVRQMFARERKLLLSLVKESTNGYIPTDEESEHFDEGSPLLSERERHDSFLMDLEIMERDLRNSTPDLFTQPSSTTLSRTSSMESIFEDAELDGRIEEELLINFSDFPETQMQFNPFLGCGQEANAPTFNPTLEELSQLLSI